MADGAPAAQQPKQQKKKAPVLYTKTMRQKCGRGLSMFQRRAFGAGMKVPAVRLTPAQKRARDAETAMPPEERCQRLAKDIVDLEAEIRAQAARFETVRAEMLTGIVTHEGVSSKQVTDQLMDQLAALRTRHSEAIAAADRAAQQRAAAADDVEERATKRRRIEEVKTEDGIKVEAEFDEQGRCIGGCKPYDLRPDDVLCLEVCTACGATYDKRLENMPGNVTFGDFHRNDSIARIGGGYKPPNHFAEIVSQFQGKRRSAAPQEIVDKIGSMCESYRFPPHKRTPDVCRMFLKQLQHEQATRRKFARMDVPEKVKKYTDYYKHCPEIAFRLSGIPPPYMTPMQENRVFALFPMVVMGYKQSRRYQSRKLNKKNRKTREEPNNMNYLYVFYKLCQLLGYDEFLPYIPLPKSFANIDDNDENGWKDLCAFHSWVYTPTVRIDLRAFNLSQISRRDEFPQRRLSARSGLSIRIWCVSSNGHEMSKDEAGEHCDFCARWCASADEQIWRCLDCGGGAACGTCVEQFESNDFAGYECGCPDGTAKHQLARPMDCCSDDERRTWPSPVDTEDEPDQKK